MAEPPAQATGRLPAQATGQTPAQASGQTPAQLAATFALSVQWVEERIEAARLCIEKQVRLELVN